MKTGFGLWMRCCGFFRKCASDRARRADKGSLRNDWDSSQQRLIDRYPTLVSEEQRRPDRTAKGSLHLSPVQSEAQS